MVDISAIAGMISALKGATDITKAMVGLHDLQAVQSKVIELNGKILEAQGSAFAANDERSALLARLRDLESEISRLTAWETEKQRYELTEVSQGVFAYTMKAGQEQGQPSHMLCANCFDRDQRSILQATQELDMRRRVHVCPYCKTKLAIGAPLPRSPTTAQVMPDYDPFTGKPM